MATNRQKNLKEIVNRFSRRYNEFPVAFRHIAGMIITEMRVQQLNLEKARLTKTYKRNLRAIDAHIRSLENKLIRGDLFEAGKTLEIED